VGYFSRFATMARTASRQGGLDGLRGLAALAVFGVHVWIYQLADTFRLNREGIGEFVLFETRVAFVMFFVLSGYLLYRPFARAALGESAPASVGSYLIRRAARIMPAYYLALAGALVLLATAGDVEGRRLVDAAQLPIFLVFGQNYFPETLLHVNAATWTLVVEVAFYLMLPLVALVALRCCFGSLRRQVALLSLLVVAGIGFNVVDYAAGWGAVASHSPPSFLPYFACGMLVALAVEGQRAGRLRALGAGASSLLVVAAALMLLANGYWHATDAHPDGFVIEAIADLPAAVAFASLIAALVIGTGSGLRWLAAAPLAWFGQISYGFYLWHIPLIVWARGHGLLAGGIATDLAVLVPAATAFGAASWYLVERPLMRRAARGARTVGPSEQSRERAELAAHRNQARTIALANPRP
jgi:acetyltransferase